MSIKVVGVDDVPKDMSSSVRSIAISAKQAVTEFGFASGELRLVSHYINTAFQLRTESSRFVVRVHRATNRSTGEVASELAWLDALSLANVRVPGVRRTPEGNAVVTPAIPDSDQNLPVTILDWMPGRAIVDDKGTNHFEELGRMTATLHRHAQTWTSNASLNRPTYDSKTVFRSDIQERLVEMLGSVDAEPINTALLTLRERLQSSESTLGLGSDRFGLIHGDLSFGNVLFDEIGAIPIDFDDCGFGYFLHDLAVPLAGAWTKPGFEERYQAFLVGYRQIRELPIDLLLHVPVFIGLRSAQLIMDYAGSVPSKQGILDQYRTRLLPALGASETDFQRIH